MGIFGIPDKSERQFFKLRDWLTPVPQRTLAELGLPAKYAVDRSKWQLIESGELEVSADSYPFTHAIVGTEYLASQLWLATPAFAETYETPVKMLWSLIHIGS